MVSETKKELLEEMWSVEKLGGAQFATLLAKTSQVLD